MLALIMAAAFTIPDSALRDPEFGALMSVLDTAYLSWTPRADQPERYDEQASFVLNRDPGVAFLIGGNGAGTSEAACHKAARFLMDTPPPRKDAPYWFIANTYEQVCNALWKEKLHGRQHIPDFAVDWGRVSWINSAKGWPSFVPLKPHANGNNWVLCFKSYEQGRAQMQAESIGGFMFSEQFPWGILEEVLRGCREYNLPGSKICEFTPVDPNLSIELEKMLEEDALPPGWRVYRANTECALEAGHVDPQWYAEFFGMVADEMLETRTTGAFATYEGAIYRGWNPAIHLVGDEVINFPRSIYHRRAIDWGAGLENAFCCLWGYRNGMGQWFIYDEYYSTDQTMTTVDHLCAVQDRWPWPSKSPYYGTTYADPSSPDNIRLAQKLSRYAPGRSPLQMTRGANAVLEGIEHVQWLLKVDHSLSSTELGRLNGKPGPYASGAPRLFVHRENCPNLARQMRTYRWRQGSDAGRNPVDARREPLKKNDHAVDTLRYLCFSEARLEGGFVPASGKKEFDGRKRGIQFQGGRGR